MEIYPLLQLKLLLSAFSIGVASGLVFELLPGVLVLLSVYEPPSRWRALYGKQLPLLRHPLVIKSGKGKRAMRALVRALCDVLFCIAFSVALILLLYDQNDGAIRLSVPVLALLGLAAFRAVFGRFTGALCAWFGFLLCAARAYLCAILRLPLVLALLLWRFCLRPPVMTVILGAWHALLRLHSHRLCRAQLRLAGLGFAIFEERKKHHEKRKKRPLQVGHSRVDHRDLPRDSRHRGQPPDGVESAPKRKGSAGGASTGA